MTFTKKHYRENQKMQEMATELILAGNSARETAQVIQEKFPDVAWPRIRRTVNKVCRLNSTGDQLPKATHGGPGRGQGQKPKPDKRYVQISLKLPPDVLEWLDENVSNRNGFIVELLEERKDSR